MVRLRRPKRREDEERMLPLINVVFLLLVFFMIAGTLAASDPFEITPIHSTSDGAPAAETILIHVGAKGQLALNGEVLDRARLIEAVERLEPAPDARDIQIRADGAAAAAAVVALLQELRRSGVASVRLMTVPSRTDDGFLPWS